MIIFLLGVFVQFITALSSVLSIVVCIQLNIGALFSDGGTISFCYALPVAWLNDKFSWTLTLTLIFHEVV